MAPHKPSSSFPALIIIFFYFMPVSIWIFYTYYTAPLSYSWAVAVVGIFIVCMGSALLFTLMRSIEEEGLVEVESPRLQLETHHGDMEALKISFQGEKGMFLKQIDDIQQQIQIQREALNSSQSELKQVRSENSQLVEKLKMLQEHQAQTATENMHRIDELSQQVEQKQQVIFQLENQIQDLRYEIKTLLQLTEDYGSFDKEAAYPSTLLPEGSALEEVIFQGTIKSEDDAKKLLKRCLQIAQKINSSYHPPNLRGIAQEPYVFDLRRLKDAIKGEEGAIILVYSAKEEKVLFANKATKALLGWGSDKFAKDFSEILGHDFSSWKTHTAELIMKSEVTFPLECKAKNGDLTTLRVVAGTIPTGAFHSLIIAIAYNNS